MVMTVASQINSSVNKEEILAVLTPYIQENLDQNDPLAQKWLRQRRNGIIHLIFNNIVKCASTRTRGRTHEDVKTYYESGYAALDPTTGHFTPRGRFLTYTYNGRVLKKCRYGQPSPPTGHAPMPGEPGRYPR